jgi:hypothetical protein
MDQEPPLKMEWPDVDWHLLHRELKAIAQERGEELHAGMLFTREQVKRAMSSQPWGFAVGMSRSGCGGLLQYDGRGGNDYELNARGAEVFRRLAMEDNENSESR